MTARPTSIRSRRLVTAGAALLVLSACGDAGTGTVAAVQATTSPGPVATNERVATKAPTSASGQPATSIPTPAAAVDTARGPTAAPGWPDATITTPSPTSPSGPLHEPDNPVGLVDPTRIEIPAIGVDARVIDLSLGNGDPEVPEGWDDAGWYVQTRNPGEIGPAVIAGHVDSRAGPAVFFRLDELAHGDEVIVHGQGGASRRFVVTGSGQYPKTDLPDEVFGFGKRVPELRLITCGGTFDPEAGHYRDNHVVYTRLAA